MATLRLHDLECSLALPIWVFVFSHFVLVRTLMIVPENRGAIAPRDQEESMNSTIIHSLL